MYTEYNQKRAKTANFRLKNPQNQYHPTQTNNFRDIYINQSPTYYNQYRYKPEDEEEYMQQIQYIHNRKKPAEYYNDNKNFQRTMKNLNIRPDYFLNEFNSIKENIGQDNEKTFLKRKVKTYKNKSPSKIDGNYYLIENVKKSDDLKIGRNIISYREYDHQSYEGINKQKRLQRNGPLQKKNIFHTDRGIEISQSYVEPVAQKICNIVIKAEPKKDKDKTKKLKSDKKQKNEGFTKNIEIEGNVAQGSAIPFKKLNININSNNNTNKSITLKKDSKPKITLTENIYDYNNENNDLKEEKNLTDINNKRRTNENNEKEILKNKTKEKNIRGEEQDIRGQEEEIEDEEEQEQEEGHMVNENEEEIEDGQEQAESEQVDDQGEIEQLEDEEEDNNKNNNMIEYENENEEENNGINKQEIEELEEEEQHQIQISNNINSIKDKQIDYKLQKENEIQLKGIKTNKPIMKIEKFQVFQKANIAKPKPKKNYYRLRVIKDNKIKYRNAKSSKYATTKNKTKKKL